MSFKAKNLTYESNEPAFLRRLRGQVGPEDDARLSGRVVSKQPTRPDEDDEPTYVLEESNDTISKDEYEELVKKQEGASEQDLPGISPEKAAEDDTKPPVAIKSKKTSQIVEAGQRKKRKAVKIIGEEPDEPDTKGPDDSKKTPAPKTSKPKRKQIKLSFDED